MVAYFLGKKTKMSILFFGNKKNIIPSAEEASL